MRFKTYDAIGGAPRESEIIAADANTLHLYIQTWVPHYVVTILKEPDFGYALFEWDTIIKASFILGFKYKCFAAMTDSRLDGLICISMNDKLTVNYIAIAPWNYYRNGKMRGIGSGLLYFVIMNSFYNSLGGEFF